MVYDTQTSVYFYEMLCSFPYSQLSTKTDLKVEGDPEMFPLNDFVAHEDKFGFELGRACFCDKP